MTRTGQWKFFEPKRLYPYMSHTPYTSSKVEVSDVPDNGFYVDPTVGVKLIVVLVACIIIAIARTLVSPIASV